MRHFLLFCGADMDTILAMILMKNGSLRDWEQNGVPTLRLSLCLPVLKSDGFRFPFDGHATANAYTLVANALNAFLDAKSFNRGWCHTASLTRTFGALRKQCEPAASRVIWE